MPMLVSLPRSSLLLITRARTRNHRIAGVLAWAVLLGGLPRVATGEAPCDPDHAGLRLAEGYCARLFAADAGAVRNLAVAPDGTVFVSLRDRDEPAGLALRDDDGDGRADRREAFGPSGPAHGLLVDAQRVWLAYDRRVLRFPRRPDALAPGEPVAVVEGLPEQRSHAHKAIALGVVEGSERLFVAVGAPSNACQKERRTAGSPGLEPCPQLEWHGGIWHFDAARAGQTQADGVRHATGMRHVLALAPHPDTGQLFGAMNGRDQLHSLWGFSHERNAELPAEEMLAIDAFDDLVDFARIPQSQTRMASVLARVDTWASAADSVTDTVAADEDIDLDGENEHLLYNNRVFAVLEDIGGRVVGGWVRVPGTSLVYQVVGNFVSYAGIDTSEEGTSNVNPDGSVNAHRTSCLKDVWDGTQNHVNDMYTVTTISNGYQAVFGDIQKRITLAPSSSTFEVNYTMSGATAASNVYVRNGLSPDLLDLLQSGQANIGELQDSGDTLQLVNSNEEVTVLVGYGDGIHTANYNASAVDDNPGGGHDFETRSMRNQAQTQQVELFGQGSFAFSLVFGVGGADFDGDGLPDDVDPDDDNDGMPDDWETMFGLNPFNAADAAGNLDGDQLSNLEEYIANTNPTLPGDELRITNLVRTVTGDMRIGFPGKTNRHYYLSYNNEPLAGTIDTSWQQATPSNQPLMTVTGPAEFVDDGTDTSSHPTATNAHWRWYYIDVRLPGEAP